MAENRHGKLTTSEGIHIPYQWAYANAAARTGASGFVAADVGKFCRQLDTEVIYMLSATTPTWVQVTGSGSATVTSVALSAAPASVFGVSGSPVTTSGTLALTMDNQNANLVLAGPASGAAAEPAFRALVSADLPAGSVVQVVSTTVSAATFSTNSASFTAITGMSATITPKKNTNKILVIFSVQMASVASCSVRIMRDSTPIAIGDAGGANQPRASAQIFTGTNYIVSESNMNYLDSPATTSAVVYSLEVESDGANAVYLNKSYGDADNDIYKRVVSTITLLEIAA